MPGPREGPRTGGRHRGTLREKGDVDGAWGGGGGGGWRWRSPGTWLLREEFPFEIRVLKARRPEGGCSPHAEAEGVQQAGLLACLGATLAGSPGWEQEKVTPSK